MPTLDNGLPASTPLAMVEPLSQADKAATSAALRIAIVGCGKIADQHVAAIHRIPNCQIVALCDRELLMARQLGERFGISNCFSDLSEMLKAVTPDVVHVTTPPQGHAPLAKQCLAAGCHVYLEKPFAITTAEAEELIALAKKKNLSIAAGHNYQFTLEMLEMRRLVAAGYLGGKPVHAECHWAYDLSDSSYVSPILNNPDHWVRQLPGQLFHNLISHGIARLAEFLSDDVELVAQAYQSERLRDLGGSELKDELRVLLRDDTGTTAFFCFSTGIKPGPNCLHLYGSRNSLLVDQNSGSLLRLENKSCKSYLTYFLPPLRLARENFRNALRNVLSFLTGRLHQDFGMKELIERFYRSIRSGGPPPLPYREIILTARIMDEIFAQIYPMRERLGSISDPTKGGFVVADR